MTQADAIARSPRPPTPMGLRGWLIFALGAFVLIMILSYSSQASDSDKTPAVPMTGATLSALHAAIPARTASGEKTEQEEMPLPF